MKTMMQEVVVSPLIKAITLALSVAACCDTCGDGKQLAELTMLVSAPQLLVNKVLLAKDAYTRVSSVSIRDGHCWAAWGAEDYSIMLREDGTALSSGTRFALLKNKDGHLESNIEYVWTLNILGEEDPVADALWFLSTCADGSGGVQSIPKD